MEIMERQLVKAKQKANSSTIRANTHSMAGIANKTNMASMANVANAANNYQLRSAEPKSQLIKTDTTAYTS